MESMVFFVQAFFVASSIFLRIFFSLAWLGLAWMLLATTTTSINNAMRKWRAGQNLLPFTYTQEFAYDDRT